MKKILLIFIVLTFSLTVALLFHPRSVKGEVSTVRLNPEDVKEVFYVRTQKIVCLSLKQEIDGLSRLEFVNFSMLEALKLMDMLTSRRVIVVQIDPDSGYIYDVGFSY